MVQTVMEYLPETPSLDVKLSVIETLRTVTEGKIFVEVERARVTKVLSDIKKEQGDLKAAMEILCELQVETFGSMERREKTEFILEQVALCIENEDWTQAGILSRKISTKYLSRKQPKTEEQLKKEEEDRVKRRNRGEDVPEPKEDGSLQALPPSPRHSSCRGRPREAAPMSPAHNLLRHPGAVRQRAARPPSPHPARHAQHTSLNRG
jgi:26S proteasome regulatory subunit N5